MRRTLVLSHRYLGIAISLVFLLWFLSGFVIIYTGGMPSLTMAERLQHQADIDLSDLRVSPAQAQTTLATTNIPILRVIMGRPAYQFNAGSARGIQTVFADDGSILGRTQLSSRRIAAQFSGIDESLIERFGRVEEVDQWTLGLRAELPLEKYLLNDRDRTEIYVSPVRGQVVLSTTQTDRLLAWMGAIPHWLYFLDLRKHSALWSDVVIWLSSLGTVLALLGLILLFTQLKKIRPFSLAKAIPYRGMMRWHYLSGMIFGVVTLTWVFSGLLSMEPYRWMSVRGLDIQEELFQGGAIDLSTFNEFGLFSAESDLTELAGLRIKEIRFRRAQGEHFYELFVVDEESPWGMESRLVSAASLRIKTDLFSTDYIREQLATLPSLRGSDVLTDYDAYYYSRASSGGPAAPLPVLRLQFDDPADTWYYIDLKTGSPAYRVHRTGRIKRWLYNGLHSLDFSFWYQQRPLWDIGLIVLLLGGLTLSGFGAILGIRRLFKKSR